MVLRKTLATHLEKGCPNNRTTCQTCLCTLTPAELQVKLYIFLFYSRCWTQDIIAFSYLSSSLWDQVLMLDSKHHLSLFKRYCIKLHDLKQSSSRSPHLRPLWTILDTGLDDVRLHCNITCHILLPVLLYMCINGFGSMCIVQPLAWYWAIQREFGGSLPLVEPPVV